MHRNDESYLSMDVPVPSVRHTAVRWTRHLATRPTTDHRLAIDTLMPGRLPHRLRRAGPLALAFLAVAPMALAAQPSGDWITREQDALWMGVFAEQPVTSRFALAVAAFNRISNYDAAISDHLSSLLADGTRAARRHPVTPARSRRARTAGLRLRRQCS